MSKSKGKRRAAPAAPKKRRVTGAERQARKNVAKNSTIIFWITAIILVLLFVGRWVVAIANGYFGAFFQVDYSAASAVDNMKGRTPAGDDADLLLPLEKRWDLFTASRLRDEVHTTADDGAELHGYLYNEGAGVTVVVLPQFYDDGTADFLPGEYLNELTGCNLLLPDPRCHGGSGGEYFSYGLTEQYDLAAWLRWADEALGEQTYILWGTGTGANTALYAAANGLLPDSVAFLVAESPYASLHEMAQAHIARFYSVPAFPFLTAIEIKTNRSNTGFTVADIDLAPVLSGSDAELPALFLLSASDAYILPAWSESVISLYPGPSETITDGTGHGTVYAAGQSAVETLLADWWSRYGG